MLAPDPAAESLCWTLPNALQHLARLLDSVRALIAGGRKAVTGPVEGAEDRPQDAIRDLKKLKVTSADAVVGLAASGSTPYILAAIGYANKQKALTIGLASNQNSPLLEVAPKSPSRLKLVLRFSLAPRASKPAPRRKWCSTCSLPPRWFGSDLFTTI